MTSFERALYRRRTLLFVIAALLFLGGAVGVAFLQIRHESHRADQLADEADLRGTAVSTLAGDVRALRSQVQAGGHTPVAPDPSKAVSNLPDRTAVPVPIPGPPGPKGDKGDPGSPAPSASPGATGQPGSAGSPGADSTVPGPQGVQGVPGADSTVPGPAGPAGAPGADSTVPGPAGPAGRDGADGRTGATGAPPAGWSWTDPAGVAYTCSPVAGFDPSAPRYTCTADAATTPSPASNSSSRGLLGVGMLSATAIYRRL